MQIKKNNPAKDPQVPGAKGKSQRQKKLPTSEKVFLSLENYPLGKMIITILFKKSLCLFIENLIFFPLTISPIL